VQNVFRQLSRLIALLEIVGSDCVSFLVALFRNRAALAAENLFLRSNWPCFRSVRRRPNGRLPQTASSSPNSLAFLIGGML
jgi:hypothetical protein